MIGCRPAWAPDQFDPTTKVTEGSVMNAATRNVTVSLTEEDGQVFANAVLQAGGKVFEGSGTAATVGHATICGPRCLARRPGPADCRCSPGTAVPWLGVWPRRTAAPVRCEA